MYTYYIHHISHIASPTTMSQPAKPATGSSLGSLPKPGSAPSSPRLISSQLTSNSSTSNTGSSNVNIDDKFKSLELQQQQSTRDLTEMKSMLMTLMTKISTQTSINSSNDNSNAPAIVSSIVVPQHSHAQPSVTVSRSLVNNQVESASKQLFNLSSAQHAAIQTYSNSNSNANSNSNSTINSNSNLNNTYHDDDVDTTIDIERKLNVSSTNSMPSFISALMPQPVSASPTSIVDLLQSGLKTAAANHEHKIKSVEDFLKLLNEQAKHIVQHKGDVTDFLLYTMNLMKYLTEYGLQATLYYHFELLKKMQSGEVTQLHLDQPMIYINMTSRFSRLNQASLLASQKIGSTSTATKSGYKSNTARTNTTKFTGTPCPFHTKQLGKPANHSEADCRVKGGSGTKQ